MVRKKILVVTDHMPWGHRSIARAIYGFLKKKESEISVEYAEVRAETGMGNDVYAFVYRYFPLSNRLAGWISLNKQARKIVTDLSVINMPALKRVVDRVKPDLIICCYWFHSHTLVRLRKKEGANWKLWSIVADPWSMLPPVFVPEADLNLVYDQVGVRQAKKYGVKSDRVVATGWWVRGEMYGEMEQREVNRLESRRKLGIPDDRKVIFVGGGSLGTNSLARLLPVLMMIKKKCAFVFNTGTDKLLHSMVDEYVRLLSRMHRGKEIIVRNLGWIENMSEVLAGCDIVFGKAGPNFLFDVIACQKPFVAITHIGGQEDGNIEIIKKKRLGWVKEKPSEAAEFLLEYLRRPKYYEKMYAANIRKEAESNKKTMEKIWEMIEKSV